MLHTNTPTLNQHKINVTILRAEQKNKKKLLSKRTFSKTFLKQMMLRLNDDNTFTPTKMSSVIWYLWVFICSKHIQKIQQNIKFLRKSLDCHVQDFRNFLSSTYQGQKKKKENIETDLSNFYLITTNQEIVVMLLHIILIKNIKC